MIKVKSRFLNLATAITPDPGELFRYLIALTEPAGIMDIGSRDATEAKGFKRISPKSLVMAIEPHPMLFKKIEQDQEVERLGIRPLNFAIADKEGILPFYINDPVSLNGSLRESANSSAPVEVAVTTMDNILARENVPSLALWIDAEGLAYEILQGGRNALENVWYIHTEFETQPIFTGQKIFRELLNYLADKGFCCVAISYCEPVSQGNALFVRQRFVGLSLTSRLKTYFIYYWLVLKSLYRKIRYR